MLTSFEELNIEPMNVPQYFLWLARKSMDILGQRNEKKAGDAEKQHQNKSIRHKHLILHTDLWNPQLTWIWRIF